MMVKVKRLIKKPEEIPITNKNQDISQNHTNKAIVFDSGTLISFSMNGITDLIKSLKGVFDGKFLITSEIKKEVIDTPLKIKKFKLEALKIKHLLDEGVLEMPSSLGIKDSEISIETNKLLDEANTIFRGNGTDIHLLDVGECSCIALSRILTNKGIENVLAVDERTTRNLVENPKRLKEFLEKKLHVKIKVKKEGLKQFSGFKIIRSAELVYIAYKKDLTKLKNHDVLDSLLYAVKYKGAAISNEEIEEIKSMA